MDLGRGGSVGSRAVSLCSARVDLKPCVRFGLTLEPAAYQLQPCLSHPGWSDRNLTVSFDSDASYLERTGAADRDSDFTAEKIGKRPASESYSGPPWQQARGALERLMFKRARAGT